MTKPKKIGRPKEVFLCECGKAALKVYVEAKDSKHKLKDLYYCPVCKVLLKRKLVKFELKKTDGI